MRRDRTAKRDPYGLVPAPTEVTGSFVMGSVAPGSQAITSSSSQIPPSKNLDPRAF